MSVIKIDKNNFETEVLQSDKEVILDFWASWCGPCRMMAPILEEVSNENPHVKIGKVNVDEESELASAFKISSIPAFFLIKDGKVQKKLIGAMSKEDFAKKLLR